MAYEFKLPDLGEGLTEGEVARWLVTEGQELAARQAYRLPARTDLPAEKLPDWAREVLRDMKPAADVRWDLIEQHGQEWMSTWDRTVRGKGAGS